MRLCRCLIAGEVQVALYEETAVVPLPRLPSAQAAIPQILDYLAPDGPGAAALARVAALSPGERELLQVPLEQVKLLVPIAEPRKIILLAGNYAEHIVEGGGQAAERKDTFPYYFMKPPTTTLTHPGDPVRIPAVSPHHIDWEIELGVVMGRRCHRVSEAEALAHVAGYTVCNDISDRKFQINPERKKREKDGFFDWLHGKWHDTFLPMGPCVRVAEPGLDPQTFRLQLRLNGQVMQDATTGQMVFPVAALVAGLSQFVTLEPGDILSTGTPSGVGFARKPPIFLQAGDRLEAEIAGIGTLSNPVVGE